MARILVTGASAGLGRLTVDALAAAGHAVVLHARSPERLEDRSVLDRVAGAVYGDLADLAEVIRIAHEANALGAFDAVIHNAGVIGGREVYAVNAVAPYVLSALLPAARRHVYLSSSLHFDGRTDLDAIDFADASGRDRPYDDSKLLVTTLAHLVARLRPAVLSHSVDPGWVPTRMGGGAAPDDLGAGHATQEWLATADEHAIAPRSGAYWRHGAPQPPHPATLDEAFQDALAARLAAHTGIALAA